MNHNNSYFFSTIFICQLAHLCCLNESAFTFNVSSSQILESRFAAWKNVRKNEEREEDQHVVPPSKELHLNCLTYLCKWNGDLLWNFQKFGCRRKTTELREKLVEANTDWKSNAGTVPRQGIEPELSGAQCWGRTLLCHLLPLDIAFVIALVWFFHIILSLQH